MSRSLADDLRQRSDDQLRALLTARPDLVNPVAPDISALAARAGSSPSVLRAIDSLDKFSLQVLETICALGEEVNPKEVIGYTDKSAKKVIDRLYELALVYGDAFLRVPVTVREAMGNEPAGLGPGTGLDVKAALKLLDDAPLASNAVLERLIWGPPRGVVGDIRQASEGVAWLLNNKLLMPIDRTTVVLPRELAIALRGNRIHRTVEVTAPELEGKTPDKVDQFGAHAASTIVRWVEELLETWSHDPAGLIRAGGLGVRELRRISELLDVDEVCAGFVVELAYAAGLANVQSDQALPTTFFDIWMTYDNAQRWETLAQSWIDSVRVAGLIGSQSRNIAVLGPELERPYAPLMRKQFLSLLAETDLAPTPESLEARLAWFMPRRGASLRKDFVQWSLRETEWLGLTSRGAMTLYGQELLKGKVKSLAKLIPTPIDHIMIQADLTAIAPGPLESELSREMSLLADVESRGGATVYRFTESSIRRGLDSGRTADEITELLATSSKTPLPQPLKYLIADVGKRHGTLRVGYAGSYVRCDDEATLSAMVNDKKVSSLRLRRLAPSILVSSEEPEIVVEVLADAGYAPAAEEPDGTLMIRKLHSRRAPRRDIKSEAPVLNDLLLDSAITTMRGGDKAILANKSPKTALPKTSETMSFLQQAIIDQGSLWIGVADPHGGITERIVDPISIQRGQLIAYDHTTKEEKLFPIFRITAVARVE